MGATNSIALPLSFTPDSRHLLTFKVPGCEIVTFDVATGKQISSIPTIDPKLIMEKWTLSPDGTKLAFPRLPA
jgi:hypothetical protein